MASLLAHSKLFNRKLLIGMVHVHALPGTPANREDLSEIIKIAVEEAKLLEASGFDMVAIENMHDTPYLKRTVGPEIVASMTAVCVAVRQAIKIPFGLQILAGANKEAISVALASGACFVRCEGFVFSTVADEGIMDSDAGELLRYRHMIGADHITIFADIKKKHSSHSLTSDLNIVDIAHAAHFYRCDGVIVTGNSTGLPASPEETKAVKDALKNTDVKVLIGSGITPSNLHEYWDSADAFIVGSYFKKGGFWENPIDPERAAELVKAANALREKE
ncbi:putative BtpA/SgcQ family protein [Monocercomonoides exilis]|uniref:putative BtpA/SgcQ family protein n=1 Tax=Monocercomonoides exilis TaxID=2049356 RepID=UPI00355958DC|nr:putative BtpA/SgcQ family protein [Monocercomonoides exilis]|eukprot:MONOS_5490.1-p1 / transcript=MONOS_5490.1 / gene=MONOS_5490 / organism=Monocercomonoides_exilis_PA203 / gene_product=uncharacterized protein LOC555865 / transcript_product=uncharacterized protein LOC555865 / location=Mono_scaffold00160:93120-94228(-) / protein_length=276 / sequence_SO=supercontig / SO=protein_coding / is_pseudo=false